MGRAHTVPIRTPARQRGDRPPVDNHGACGQLPPGRLFCYRGARSRPEIPIVSESADRPEGRDVHRLDRPRRIDRGLSGGNRGRHPVRRRQSDRGVPASAHRDRALRTLRAGRARRGGRPRSHRRVSRPGPAQASRRNGVPGTEKPERRCRGSGNPATTQRRRPPSGETGVVHDSAPGGSSRIHSVVAGGATTEGFVEEMRGLTNNVNRCRNTSMPQWSATVEGLT